MRHRKLESGTAVVELALMMLILMTVFVGTIDFAQLFFSGVTAAGAARAGVQHGAYSNTAASDREGMKLAAHENAANLTARTPSARNYCLCEGSTTEVNCITVTCSGEVPQLYVEVTMQSTFETFFDFPGIPSSVELAKTAVFRVQ